MEGDRVKRFDYSDGYVMASWEFLDEVFGTIELNDSDKTRLYEMAVSANTLMRSV